jgi:hypothetical protein
MNAGRPPCPMPTPVRCHNLDFSVRRLFFFPHFPADIACSVDGTLLASLSRDKTVKVCGGWRRHGSVTLRDIHVEISSEVEAGRISCQAQLTSAQAKQSYGMQVVVARPLCQCHHCSALHFVLSLV